MSLIADSSNRIYAPHVYHREAEFEKQVVDLADQIFGTEAIYIDKKKKVKGRDFSTIPDGYVIDMADPAEPRLYIVENEIVSHDPFKHIGIQILRFATSFEDDVSTIREFLMTAIQESPEALRRLEAGKKASGIRNIDAYLDHAVNKDFHGLVIIDDAQPALHRVLEKINADVSVLELRTYQSDDGKLLHQFDTLYGEIEDPLQRTRTPTNRRTVVSREQRARRLARRAASDTIVVAARAEGFRRVFIGEDRWHAIRIGAAMKNKLRRIACYQVRPISAVTHVADIKEILPWEDSGKYVVVFEGPAEKLAQPIRIEDGRFAPQSPVYVKWADLENATSFDEVFRANI